MLTHRAIRREYDEAGSVNALLALWAFVDDGTFVTKAGDQDKPAAEDDGWLMGYVVNMAEETTDLVILDAANFEGAVRCDLSSAAKRTRHIGRLFATH